MAPPVAPRTLTLTEELERLEQSITLTLQEIDQNFSHAHQIVTSSILPVVQQYATHSQSVREGSEFWKKFFESSANVSLSTYEEDQLLDHTVTTNDETTVTEDQSITDTSHPDATDISYTGTDIDETPSKDGRSRQQRSRHDGDVTQNSYLPEDSLTDTQVSPSVGAATPKPRKTTTQNATPRGTRHQSQRKDTNPQTPRTPQQTPSAAKSYLPISTGKRRAADPLLHRVLDKNYRLQATPLTARSKRQYRPKAPKPLTPADREPPSTDSSPFSPAPQLNADLFSSPQRRPQTVRQSAKKGRTPRFETPRASTKVVQEKYASAKRTLFSSAKKRTPLNPAAPFASSPPASALEPPIPAARGGQMAVDEDTVEWSDSDDDWTHGRTIGGLNMSPPKTMQFHLPRSQVMRTPAKEASRRIVEELMEGAGMGREGESSGVYEDGTVEGLGRSMRGMRFRDEAEEDGGVDDSF